MKIMLLAALMLSSADLVKVLENTMKIYELAGLIEKHRNERGSLPAGRSAREVITAFGGGEGIQQYFETDPWGTEYRVAAGSTPGRYWIVSAGADRSFGASNWSLPNKSEDPSDDVVFRDGLFLRSAHEWAIRESDKLGAISTGKLSREMDRSRASRTMTEVRQINTALFAYLTDHQGIPQIRGMNDMIKLLASTHPKLTGVDAWDTPMRITVKGDAWQIVAAGSDKKFENDPPALGLTSDYTRDLVFNDVDFLTEWSLDHSPEEQLTDVRARLRTQEEKFEEELAKRK